MAQPRAHFTTSFGFLMAATGSAVGLGNIWGFPTNAASNGGGAFLLVYLLLTFLLAYPALMAELLIGRERHANILTALEGLSEKPVTRFLGRLLGFGGLLTASLILSFYAIVAGWMLGKFLEPLAQLLALPTLARWLEADSLWRNGLLCLMFSLLTLAIVARGVSAGIERWSARLMPLLTLILVALIVYVLTLPGAIDGLRAYLLPDFSRVGDPALLLSAMGQAFFSLSLGVGTMLVYGSYLHRQAPALSTAEGEDPLPRLGASVALLDCCIAFVAGLLILPAIYVAQAQGVAVFGEAGELLAGPQLVFQVLPNLFASLGQAGVWVSLAFFALMTIAALTSSISMLEAPVSALNERTPLSRGQSAGLAAAIIFAVSLLLIFNMASLFDLVINLTTRYSQPLLGLGLCLFAGWILFSNRRLAELRARNAAFGHSLFWRIWPWYVRLVCPLLILAMLVQSLR